jgi:hypothetical protein
MSVKSDSVTDALTGTFSPAATDNYYWTVGGWFYLDSYSGSDAIAVVKNTGGGSQKALYVHSTGVLAVYDGGSSGTGSTTIPSSAWVWVAMTFDVLGNVGAWMWKSGDAKPISQATISALGSPFDPKTVYIGYDGAFDCVSGRFAYWRLWSGGSDRNSGAVLTDNEMESERVSATQVKTSGYGNGMREHWPLSTNDGTLYNGAVSVNLSNSGFVWDAATPTLGSSTVVPGIWLSRQNRAFGSARQRYT